MLEMSPRPLTGLHPCGSGRQRQVRRARSVVQRKDVCWYGSMYSRAALLRMNRRMRGVRHDANILSWRFHGDGEDDESRKAACKRMGAVLTIES